MSFKKLDQRILDAFEYGEITEISEFSNSIFTAIKSGSNLYVEAPASSGKTIAGIISTFQKVNKQLEGSPRVIYICSSIPEAVRVSEWMSKIAWRLDTTVDLAHHKGNMVLQRNEIFNGTEIIVGTIKRIYDLYIQNGINFNLLDCFIIDDLEEVMKENPQMEIKRMIEGLTKAQVVLMGTGKHSKIQPLLENLPIDFRSIIVKEES
jgi:superfamily II DNA/RNA helicase